MSTRQIDFFVSPAVSAWYRSESQALGDDETHSLFPPQMFMDKRWTRSDFQIWAYVEMFYRVNGFCIADQDMIARANGLSVSSVATTLRKLTTSGLLTLLGVKPIAEGRCEICRLLISETLSLDHDHVTGRARGYLCSNCNMAIGLLRDNVGNLLRAAKYLARDTPEEWKIGVLESVEL